MRLGDGLRERLALLVGDEIDRVEPVAGGGNNHVLCARGRRAAYAVKRYPPTVGDVRDRFGTEVAALRFVERVLPGRCPSIVAVDELERCAVYEWIEGERVGPGDAAAVDDVLALLEGLHAARGDATAQAFAPASEACLSTVELLRQLAVRRARLSGVTKLNELLVGFDRLVAAATPAAAEGSGDVPPGSRTLSPSDFGFHNALRRDGHLVFFDFEYFGWDDPVKAVADFVWHPAMMLDPALYHYFLTRSADIYGGDAAFAGRLQALLPLYGLRWSLIVLNEFLPERWSRRVAAGQTDPRGVVLERQLGKARSLLAAVDALLAKGSLL